MYSKIMVPVDLAHMPTQEKALAVAGHLAKTFGAVIDLVTVKGPPKGEDALSEQAFSETLNAVATKLAEDSGATVTAHPVRTREKHADLDVTLRVVAEDLGVDLIVMASHVPGFREYIFASNAGYIASHTDLSVFVVR